MKNHFDAFDQWILTDNWNIDNWGMDTYYGFMAASKVGSRRVFLVSHVYHAGEYQWFMVWCSWFLQNQLDEWIAEILLFLTTYSMSILMKVEAGYVTAQCRHTVIYLKSPVGGRVGAERLRMLQMDAAGWLKTLHTHPNNQQIALLPI